jgi:hypothetical protein
MIKNFFSQNNNEIEIEIEKPSELNKISNPLEAQNIAPNDLLRNYKDLKILPINPQQKRKVEELINEIKTDLQHLKRIINNF